MKYEIGDVVMLKSGIYPITVVNIDDDTVTCQWLNYRDEKYEEEFNTMILFNPVKEDIFKNFNEAAHSDSYGGDGNYALDFGDCVEYDTINIQIGSVVRFTSYHAFMTIEEIRDDTVVCIWFNKFGYIKREVFNINTLHQYNSYINNTIPDYAT